jgi:small-conductance mechanosensitive channel
MTQEGTMSWTRLFDLAGRALSAHLFTLGGVAVTPGTILTVLVVVAITLVISRLVRRGLRSVFRRRGVMDEGSVSAIVRLVHYAIVLVGTGIAVQTAGLNLNALFAAGALFAVGIGFAMQNVVQNFVAGVILLAERVIKPGDVVEVEGKVVKVVAMGIRTTIVLTRDSENLIVPNATLVQSTVKNYTLKDPVFRLRAVVGVSYSSDMQAVQTTLEQAAHGVEGRLADRDPVVMMTGFGDNSVNFEVSLWMNDAWEAKPTLSRLHQAIWWALKEKEIGIPFPQVDVHFDTPVVEGLRRLSPAS